MKLRPPVVKANVAGFKAVDEFRLVCSVFPTILPFDDTSNGIAVVRKTKVSLGHQINHQNKRELKVWADTSNIHPRDYAARLAEIQAEILSNGIGSPAPSVASFYGQYVVSYSQLHHKDSHGFLHNLKLLIGNCGHIQLAKVSKPMIVEALKGVSKGSYNRCLARINKFFNLAIDCGYINHNPCRGIPKLKENAPRDRVLSLSEIQTLIEAALTDINPVHAGCILLCLFIGLRQGNVRELELSWFDADFTTLSIPDSKSGKPVFITLNSVVQFIVKRALAYSDGTYLFPASNSTPITPKHMAKPTKCMARLVAQVQAITGVTEHFHCHDLRRTHSSLMLQLTGDIRLCQQTLGHADIKTTQRYAYHSNPQLLAASEQTATALLGDLNLHNFNLTTEKQ